MESRPTFLDAFKNGLPACRTHLPFDGAADVVAAVEPFRCAFALEPLIQFETVQGWGKELPSGLEENERFLRDVLTNGPFETQCRDPRFETLSG
jgi:hypothetical protein